MNTVHYIKELCDRVDALKAWNIWDRGIQQEEPVSKCVVGGGRKGGAEGGREREILSCAT